MNQGASEGPIHDSLIYLPRKPITEIGKGRVIYSPENSSDRLYLVVRGRVTHKTPERVLLAFAQLADLLGTPQPDGAMRIDSLTHHTIADYVGTSREIVTFPPQAISGLDLVLTTHSR